MSHKAVANTIDGINERFCVNNGSTFLGLSKLAFDLSIYDIFGCFDVGGTLVLPNETKAKNPEHWIELVELYNIQIWNSVPALFKMYLDTMKEENKIPNKSINIALVGESGAGKSTLAKLLIHYYDVNNGKIMIGNQNICDMRLEALNELIAYVSQDNFLFNMSLMENIRIGKPTASDEEVVAAAKKAQCMDFINRLSEGIYTKAGDSGNKLSGGERQRITLARAILKDAPIIVLDEATAFTDSENEIKIESVLSELVKHKTLIVIAHRLTTIVNAQQICILDKGNLVDCGTHKELLEKCEIYRNLWKANQDSTQWQIGGKTE